MQGVIQQVLEEPGNLHFRQAPRRCRGSRPREPSVSCKVIGNTILEEDLIYMDVRGGLCLWLGSFRFPDFSLEDVKNTAAWYRKESCCLNLQSVTVPILKSSWDEVSLAPLATPSRQDQRTHASQRGLKDTVYNYKLITEEETKALLSWWQILDRMSLVSFWWHRRDVISRSQGEKHSFLLLSPSISSPCIWR